MFTTRLLSSNIRVSKARTTQQQHTSLPSGHIGLLTGGGRMNAADVDESYRVWDKSERIPTALKSVLEMREVQDGEIEHIHLMRKEIECFSPRCYHSTISIPKFISPFIVLHKISRSKKPNENNHHTPNSNKQLFSFISDFLFFAHPKRAQLWTLTHSLIRDRIRERECRLALNLDGFFSGNKLVIGLHISQMW